MGRGRAVVGTPTSTSLDQLKLIEADPNGDGAKQLAQDAGHPHVLAPLVGAAAAAPSESAPPCCTCAAPGLLVAAPGRAMPDLHRAAAASSAPGRRRR